MPVRSYHTINGKIRGSTQGGSVPLRTTHWHDSIGNVVATSNQYGVAKAAIRYSDYGAKTFDNSGWGAMRYGWIGGLGYRSLGPTRSDIYVRARHYSSTEAKWSSVVRRREMLAGEPPYAYTFNNPRAYTDRTGNDPHNDCDYNTRQYANSFKKTNNLFELCATGVSGALCRLIHTGRFGATLSEMVSMGADQAAKISKDVDDSNPITSTTIGSILYGQGVYRAVFSACSSATHGLAKDTASLTKATLAQNTCMRQLWEKKSTPEWLNARRVCDSQGASSKQCCRSSVYAEQSGYNTCAAKVFPGLQKLPFEFRTWFAIQFLHCCAD